MSEMKQVRSLIKQADACHSQGLFAESRGKYKEILSFLESNRNPQKCEKFTEAVRQRLRDVNKDISEIRRVPATQELSPQLQGLIKTLFTFSATKEAAAIESAVALAKGCHYEEAVRELRKLITEGILPRIAAKNILRCFLSLSLPEAAVAQFKEWLWIKTLSHADLRSVRDLLVSLLRRKGMNDLVPALSGEILTSVKARDDFLDIFSITIRFYDGKRHRYTVDLDVVYQIGGLSSVVVSSADRALLDSLRLGKTLRDIQFDTPVTVFRGAGIITRKSLIEKGPEKGNYLIDILLAEEGREGITKQESR